METLLWPVVNLLLLIALLFHLLRKPVTVALQGRHTTLRDEIQRVREQLTQAQARFDQFSAKLRTMESEAENLFQQSKQDATQTKEALISKASRASQTIVQEAKQGTSLRFEDLKREVRTEFSGKVLAKAEEIIRKRLTGEERARILKEFSSQMETLR